MVHSQETVRSSSEISACFAEEQNEDKTMAATTITGFSIPASASAVHIARERTSRRITPQAGRAREILAHAIEYLTSEYVQTDLTFSARNEQLEAVQLLMSLNRQVYFECPEVPSFSERCRTLLYRLAA
jgi:hypothetical protein